MDAEELSEESFHVNRIEFCLLANPGLVTPGYQAAPQTYCQVFWNTGTSERNYPIFYIQKFTVI